jgi:hypothetical protein
LHDVLHCRDGEEAGGGRQDPGPGPDDQRRAGAGVRRGETAVRGPRGGGETPLAAGEESQAGGEIQVVSGRLPHHHRGESRVTGLNVFTYIKFHFIILRQGPLF